MTGGKSGEDGDGPVASRGDLMTYRLEGVAKTVGGEIHIHPMTFDLVPGGLHVLLGPPLAGKTSVLRLLAGLERPTSGRICAGARDVTAAHLPSRNVAMVYTPFSNYPSFTVYEHIPSPLLRSGVHK